MVYCLFTRYDYLQSSVLVCLRLVYLCFCLSKPLWMVVIRNFVHGIRCYASCRSRTYRLMFLKDQLCLTNLTAVGYFKLYLTEVLLRLFFPQKVVQ